MVAQISKNLGGKEERKSSHKTYQHLKNPQRKWPLLSFLKMVPKLALSYLIQRSERLTCLCIARESAVRNSKFLWPCLLSVFREINQEELKQLHSFPRVIWAERENRLHTCPGALQSCVSVHLVEQSRCEPETTPDSVSYRFTGLWRWGTPVS